VWGIDFGHNLVHRADTRVLSRCERGFSGIRQRPLRIGISLPCKCKGKRTAVFAPKEAPMQPEFPFYPRSPLDEAFKWSAGWPLAIGV
jgi:hypothetical protein